MPSLIQTKQKKGKTWSMYDILIQNVEFKEFLNIIFGKTKATIKVKVNWKLYFLSWSATTEIENRNPTLSYLSKQ